MSNKFYILTASAALIGITAIGAATADRPGKARQHEPRSTAQADVRDYSRRTPARIRSIANPPAFMDAATASGATASGATSFRSREAAQASRHVDFGGALHFSKQWTDGPRYGLCRFSTDPESGVEHVADYYFFEKGNAAVYDGMLHAIDYNEYDGQLYVNYNKVEIATGEYLGWGSFDDLSYFPYDTDYDPVTDAVIGCFQSADNTRVEIAIAEYETRYRKVIREVPDILYALAVNSKGEIYGIDGQGTLRLYPRDGGEPVEVLKTGVKPKYMQSATFDHSTDLMYWAYTDGTESALFEIDPKGATCTRLYDFAGCEEITTLYVDTPVAEGTPAVPGNLAANINGEGQGKVSFTLPAVDFQGNALTGTLSYTVKANGVKIAEGTGEAGATVERDVTTAKGNTLFAVSCANDNGRSYPARLRSYVGDGAPVAPSNVIAAVTGNQIVLTWDAPSEGMEGAYIDTDALVYNVVRYPEGVKVVEKGADTSFTETLNPEQPTVYWYGVTAYYKDFASAETESARFPLGEAFTTPYYEDFENPDNFNLFTVLDNNHDGRVWMVGLHQGFNPTGFAFCNTNKYGIEGMEFSDDWLLTPQITLKKGEIYEFTFKAWNMWGSPGEFLSVSLGQGEDPTDASKYKEIIPRTEINKVYENAQWFTYVWIPEADGNYRIGFHGTSGLNTSAFNIDEISVKSIGRGAAPAAAEVAAVPGTKGAQEATVNITLPKKNALGDAEISSISKVELFRGETLVKEWGASTPGDRLSYTDAEPELGINTYRVVCHSAEGKGAYADAKVYVGFDIPARPLDFKATDMGDHVELSWKSPGTTGANGGYVDENDLLYEVYDIQGLSALPIKSDLEGTTFTIDQADQGQQRHVSYGVSAQTSYDLGEIAISNSVILGAPHQLPFVETFNLAKYDNDGWETSGDIEHRFYTDPDVSSDEGSTALKWAPAMGYRDAVLLSGKVAPGNGASNLHLIFDRKADAACDVKLDVYLIIDAWRKELLKTIDFAALTDKEGWATELIDLNQYAGARTLSLEFDAHGETYDASVWLDRIQVRNLLDKDLMVSLQGKKTYTTGKTGQAVIKIDNNSLAEAAGYKVKFFADDELVSTIDGEPIAPLGYRNYEVSLTPSAAKKGTIALRAEVEFTGDQDMANNVSATHNATLAESTLAAPTALSASEDASGVKLTWTAPEIVDDEVVEDFEKYDNGDLVFGDWKTIDVDKGLACGINGISMPHEREPFAFMVFNPEESGMDVTMRPTFAPIADKQYLMCMVGYYSSSPHSDDWLISPELSGEAQTIYMFMRKDNENYDERFEIYYSLTDDNIDSFILLEEGSVDDPEWSDYGFDLPEGAKYFAFRYVSNNQFFIFLDDITYRPLVPELVGYRVYSGGKVIAELGADATSYEAKGALDAADYFVTARYNTGESGPSNTVRTSSVGTLAEGDPRVAAGQGEIVLRGVAGSAVKVVAVDGIVVADTHSDISELTIAVEKGQYIVSIDGKACKVNVR